MYANKLGLKAEVLQRTLWGDFFLNTKAKRIFKGAQVWSCVLKREWVKSRIDQGYDVFVWMLFTAGKGQEANLCAICLGEYLGCL